MRASGVAAPRRLRPRGRLLFLGRHLVPVLFPCTRRTSTQMKNRRRVRRSQKHD